MALSPKVETQPVYFDCGKSSGGCRQKLVALDAGRDTAAFAARLDAHDARVTPDVHVAGERDLLGQRQDEFDRASLLDRGSDKKVETPETDVARLARLFDSSIF